MEGALCLLLLSHNGFLLQDPQSANDSSSLVVIFLQAHKSNNDLVLISRLSFHILIATEPIALSIMAGVIPSSAGPSLLIRSLTGDALLDYNLMKGDVVRHQFNAGYIVLSYLVSFVGCWTTLKLLHRRTSHRGYYNWSVLSTFALRLRWQAHDC